MNDTERGILDRKYYDIYGKERSLFYMVKNNPGWTQSRFKFMEIEIDKLKEQNKEMLEALKEVYEDYTKHNIEKMRSLIQKIEGE